MKRKFINWLMKKNLSNFEGAFTILQLLRAASANEAGRRSSLVRSTTTQLLCGEIAAAWRSSLTQLFCSSSVKLKHRQQQQLLVIQQQIETLDVNGRTPYTVCCVLYTVHCIHHFLTFMEKFGKL